MLRVWGWQTEEMHMLPYPWKLMRISLQSLLCIASASFFGADLSPLLIEKGTFTRAQPLLWLAPSSGHLATLREGNYTLVGYRGYKLPSNQARKNE